MKSIRVDFSNSSGLKLSANLEMPVTEKPEAYAIFAHCFTCSKNLSAVVNISRTLNQRGIAVLRFDFTGLGSSEGDFSDTNFSSNVNDLVSAYNYLSENYASPKIIIGHSLGGAAVLASAHQMSDVQAVVTIGAPADPVHVKHIFDQDIDKIKENGEATVNIGGRPFKVKEQLLNDLASSNVRDSLPKLKKALLVMHSPQDNIVGVENARLIYDSAHHPKSFITLDGADHLLSDKEDSNYVADLIASWSSRYVDFSKSEELTTHKQVTVRTGESGYLTEVSTENHSLLVDEPKGVGGSDLGPSPYDLLVASLGACTSMTLRMYADHKNWDLKEVKVHLEHNKEHVEDSENVNKKSAKLDHIDREIELTGDLNEEQRARLLEIADRCPVHKTLHSEIIVKTKLV